MLGHPEQRGLPSSPAGIVNVGTELVTQNGECFIAKLERLMQCGDAIWLGEGCSTTTTAKPPDCPEISGERQCEPRPTVNRVSGGTRPTRSERVFETLKQVRCALLALLLQLALARRLFARPMLRK